MSLRATKGRIEFSSSGSDETWFHALQQLQGIDAMKPDDQQFMSKEGKSFQLGLS